MEKKIEVVKKYEGLRNIKKSVLRTLVNDLNILDYWSKVIAKKYCEK